jgi:hypothetical protein
LVLKWIVGFLSCPVVGHARMPGLSETFLGIRFFLGSELTAVEPVVVVEQVDVCAI